MNDLEELLRTEVLRRSEDFEPSADLPERIESRVRQQRRKRQALAGLAAAGVAASVLAVVALVGHQSGDDLRTSDDDRTTSTTAEPTSTTTEAPDQTTSTTAEPTSTTTAPPPPDPTPGIGSDTPVSRSAIGPLTLGMTLREAEAATGMAITPGTLIGPSSSCVSAQVGDTEIRLLVELPGQEGQDLMAGTIRSIEGARSTVEGVAVGDPVARVTSILGQPTETHDDWPGGHLLLYEADGAAYALTTDGTAVVTIHAGVPDWAMAWEGCA